MYPVQMQSLMYLIFAKKQRICNTFWPTWWAGWAKFSNLIVYDSVSHSAHFPGLSAGFCPAGLPEFYFLISWRILMSSVLAVFPPTNKMYLICSNRYGHLQHMVSVSVPIPSVYNTAFVFLYICFLADYYYFFAITFLHTIYVINWSVINLSA